MDPIRSRLQDVFRRVFHDDEIAISDTTTAADIDGWDSMAHINLIIAIEKQFGVKFTTADIASMLGDGQNVGHLVRLLETKTGRAGAGGA
jgi:acyl carrier protein